MDLLETDAKALLARHAVAVPAGRKLLRAGESADNDVYAGEAVIVKAQVLRGGRAKAGLVRTCTAADATACTAELFDRLVEIGDEPLVMVEQRVEVESEHYLAWRIDDVAQQPMLIFSCTGGIEVEAARGAVRQYRHDPLRMLNPGDIVPFLRDAGLGGKALGAVARLACDLFRVFRAEDATLLEVNPVGITPRGQAVALDCKMTLDDSAVYRRPYWNEMASVRVRRDGMGQLEAKAEAGGFTFVDLQGEVAILSGGAGLGMTLIDLFAEAGYGAANFCDTVGGSGSDAFDRMTDLVFERAERDDVRVIAAFFTLSATSLKPAVVSLLEAVRRRKPPKPLVVGFAVGGPAEREMTLAEATAAFAALGYPCVGDCADLVAAVNSMLGADRDRSLAAGN